MKTLLTIAVVWIVSIALAEYVAHSIGAYDAKLFGQVAQALESQQ